MIEINFDLGQKLNNKTLEAEVDRIEVKIRESIGNKFGYEDKRRSRDAVLRLFREYDLDNTGTVNLEEFSRLMARFNFVDMPQHIQFLFNRYDRDGTGVLEYKEFALALFAQDRGVQAPPRTNPICRELLEKVRLAVMNRANGEFRGLSRTLRIMDSNRTATLDGRELRDGLRRYQVDLSDEEFFQLFSFFDRNGDGNVCVTEFIRGIRGTMSEWRSNLVRRAFSILDSTNNGEVDFVEVCNAYQVERHPDVLAKKKTASQVFDEFVADWDKDRDGTITWAEFEDYYNDISASIDNDQYFELMIRNAWHIPGGEGAAANTSNLRVLVTFQSGVQEIVTVQKDIGLDRKNIRAIEAALLRQGVRNILKISLAS
eukprot:PhF_6_TR43663/c0_g1_i1/m.67095